MENMIKPELTKQLEKTKVFRTAKPKFSEREKQQKMIVIDFDVNEVNETKNARLDYAYKRSTSFNFGRFKAEKCVKAMNDGAAQFEPENRTATTQVGKRQVTRRRRKRNEFDGELILDRYMDGCLDIYERKIKQKREQSQPVDIYINVTAACTDSADTLKAFYYDAIQEVYSLVRAGRMVNVYAFSCGQKTYRNGNWNVTRVKLKDSRQRIDFKRLAIAIYPAFLRYTFFKAWECCKLITAHAYGHVYFGEHTETLLNAAFPELEKKQLKMFDLRTWQRNGRKIK